MKTTFDTHFMFIYSYVVSDVNYMKEKRNYVFWPHFFLYPDDIDNIYIFTVDIKTTLALCINYHYLRIS